MEVELLSDPRRFVKLAAGWLAADPFSTNVIGVHTASVVSGRRPLGPDDIWLVAKKDDHVVGAAMQTPPHRLALPRVTNGAAAHMAAALLDAGRALPGVSGVTTAVHQFVTAWTGRAGRQARRLRSMRFYRLEELRPPTGAGGEARLAGPAERALVVDWFAQFHREAAPGDPGRDVRALAELRVGAGQVWLWTVRGEPVSLAALSAPAAGVARIGPVYTPAGYRRRGFGSAVTAYASRAALGTGAAYVGLYADMANPTANAIYQQIGYVPDHDSEEWDFV
jgi:predicted GNAT family acetyltransferase